MKKIFLLTLLCAATIFVACDKNDNEPGDTTKVFVAGFQRNNEGIAIATLWSNGKATQLSNGTKNARGYSVYVSEGTVYVAGIDNNMATIWKNGIATPLSDESKQSAATSVFVSGSDVYVSGLESTVIDGNAVYSTIVWKNGTPTKLSDNMKFAEAYSIFVSGSDVYVAGVERNEGEANNTAVLWKNTEKILLTDGSQRGEARGVFVVGNDVYVAGFDGDKTMLWKNDKTNATILIEDSESAPLSLFVSGGKAYIGGHSETEGTLWTVSLESNAVTTKNITDASFIKSVTVFGEDIYMTGHKEESNIAKIWKNGVPTNLSSGTNRANANSIFVIK